MLHWLELEEKVGLIWHRMVGDRATYSDYPEAEVRLDDLRSMLAVLFRGLGGGRSIDVVASGERDSRHRLTWLQRLGTGAERMGGAILSDARLQLPERIAFFPDSALNRDLYIWLAAYFTVAEPAIMQGDRPLQHDLSALRAAFRTTQRVHESFPGLRVRYRRLAGALLAQRPRRPLLPLEVAVERVVVALLSDTPLTADDMDHDLWLAVVTAEDDPAITRQPGLRYRPFLPVPLWGEMINPEGRERPDADDEDDDDTPVAVPEVKDGKTRQARRKTQDQAERDDPLIFNRFDKLLAVAEMVNVNRGKDDDDEEGARKAANELDEITLSPNVQRSSARLRLDLDLPPDTVRGDGLDGEQTYPEWDYRRGVMLPDHCRVVTSPADEEGEDWQPDDTTRRLIHRVRRQFEALRPRQMTFRRQADGDELDIEAVVRGRCDQQATGETSDRVYLKTRAVARDLSVAVLMDVSLSTDAWIEDRRVIDVEKEALSVFLSGLSACGDENAVFTFTSRRRDWVRVQTVKDFDESFDDRVLRRIAALKPGYYTRIGAAVRHVTTKLEARPHRHRLLLIVTDGKPNDVDHYEGRFGIEDTRRAIAEARRKGLTVFGVTIDREAQDYFPALFGRGHYAIVGDLKRLSRALPRIYQSLSQ